MILVHPGVNLPNEWSLRRSLSVGSFHPHIKSMRPQSIHLDIIDVYFCEQLCKVVELSSEPKLNY